MPSSSMPWIKLYTETLDDPKMGRLGDRLWRRALEVFMLAGKTGAGGFLPPVEDMAWILRTSMEELATELVELENVNIVKNTPDGWFVVHFAERQDADSNAERQRRYRERKQRERYAGTEETSRKGNSDVTESNEAHNEPLPREEEDKEKEKRIPSPPQNGGGRASSGHSFWKPDILQLAQVFAKARGSPIPPLNGPKDFAKVTKRWKDPLEYILGLCDGNQARAVRLIEITVKHMVGKLTFSAPDQILKTAESMDADLKNGTLTDPNIQLTEEERMERFFASLENHTTEDVQ